MSVVRHGFASPNSPPHIPDDAVVGIVSSWREEDTGLTKIMVKCHPNSYCPVGSMVTGIVIHSLVLVEQEVTALRELSDEHPLLPVLLGGPAVHLCQTNEWSPY